MPAHEQPAALHASLPLSPALPHPLWPLPPIVSHVNSSAGLPPVLPLSLLEFYPQGSDILVGDLAMLNENLEAARRFHHEPGAAGSGAAAAAAPAAAAAAVPAVAPAEQQQQQQEWGEQGNDDGRQPPRHAAAAKGAHVHAPRGAISSALSSSPSSGMGIPTKAESTVAQEGGGSGSTSVAAPPALPAVRTGAVGGHGARGTPSPLSSQASPFHPAGTAAGVAAPTPPFNYAAVVARGSATGSPLARIGLASSLPGSPGGGSPKPSSSQSWRELHLLPQSQPQRGLSGVHSPLAKGPHSIAPVAVSFSGASTPTGTAPGSVTTPLGSPGMAGRATAWGKAPPSPSSALAPPPTKVGKPASAAAAAAAPEKRTWSSIASHPPSRLQHSSVAAKPSLGADLVSAVQGGGGDARPAKPVLTVGGSPGQTPASSTPSGANSPRSSAKKTPVDAVQPKLMAGKAASSKQEAAILDESFSMADDDFPSLGGTPVGGRKRRSKT
jgi:hypothetical protein